RRRDQRHAADRRLAGAPHHLHDHHLGDGEARGRRRSAEGGRQRGGAEGRARHDHAVARDLRERAPGRERRRDHRQRAARHARAHAGQGRDPRRGQAGDPRRGGPGARARQGGGRDGIRAGVGVTGGRARGGEAGTDAVVVPATPDAGAHPAAAWRVLLAAALLGLVARPVLAAEAPSAPAARAWSAAEYQARLDRLQQRTKAFYELLERGERERAAPLWPEIERELASLGDELQERLDQMRQDVMDRDGDLEELYRSSRWRETEIMSLVVTYHLAWVRYQRAQLAGDAARRKDLLQKAVRGFS